MTVIDSYFSHDTWAVHDLTLGLDALLHAGLWYVLGSGLVGLVGLVSWMSQILAG
jgi:hypothetical protein